MSNLDTVCEKLGITLLPWQREYAEAVLSGEQVVLQRGRKVGWTTVQQVITAVKEEEAR